MATGAMLSAVSSISLGQIAFPAAAPQGVQVHPAPPWIVEREIPEPDVAQFDAVQGVHVLVVDIQHDATIAEPARYTRLVARATEYVGVSQVSQFAFPYDPAHQRLEFNHVRVIRDGLVQDRRDRSHLDTLRREELLEFQMLTGKLTATLRLDDIRVGDLVDIAYTVYGVPRAFEGHDVQQFQLRSIIPVERASIRSRWPRDARWEIRGAMPELEVTRDGRTVLFEAGPVATDAEELEYFVPPDTPVIPTLLVANFGDWSDVADWGRPLFDVAPDPQVAALARVIAEEHPLKADQVAAALHFVQQEVRYFALVLGEGGYVPVEPSRTLATRSGDCKAKTALFLALMDELGVDAEAALINSAVGEILDELPPSPAAFDHVLARVMLDGETYWVDPSQLYQVGDLNTLAQSDHGFALPLDASSGGLVDMEASSSAAETSVRRDTYDLTAGFHAPARVSIESTWSGTSADDNRGLRSYVSASDLDEAVRLTFEDAYGAATVYSAGRLEDDARENRLVASMELELPDAFEDDLDQKRRTFRFTASGIIGPVPAIDTSGRRHPLQLLYKGRVRHEVTVLLPDTGWRLRPESEVIENEAFRFNWTVTPGESSLKMIAELNVSADAISPESIARVTADQDRMLEKLSYLVWIPTPARLNVEAPELESEIRIDIPRPEIAPPGP